VSKKLGIRTCREAALLNNGLCLSDKYGKIQDAYKWKCSQGHVWETSFVSVRQGSWCPKCAFKSNRTIDNCIDLAKSRDGYFLSEEYTNAKTKYIWKCKEGHIWRATYDSVSSKKTWCPSCSNRKRKTVKDCQNLAIKNGGSFLNERYSNAHTKYKWRCKEGCIWEATYNQIEQGYWCPKCYGAISIQDCIDIATAKGGKFLSECYVNNKTKMLWQCKYGHQWESSLASIKYKNRWCPKCQGFNSKRNPPTTQDCNKIANSNGGKFLSSEYVKSNSKYLWECKKGHKWKSTYNAVQQGYWCSKCRASKSQRYIYNILKEHFSACTVMFNYKDFDWLKTSARGKMELDIFVIELKLAIEYDGEQHFMPVKFGGMSEKQAAKAFSKQKERDIIKNNLIKQNSNDVKYFVRFNYKENLKKEYIIDKIKLVTHENL